MNKIHSCFVLGIVKGIEEHGDTTRYFGSTLGMSWHILEAIDAGFIEGNKVVRLREARLTPEGKAFYKQAGLKYLPECRSYMWGRERIEEAALKGSIE